MPSETDQLTTMTIEALDDWIVRQGLEVGGLPEFVEGLAPRLAALGIPLWRLHIARSTLDPSYSGTGCSWVSGQGVQMEGYAHGTDVEQRWQQSPLRTMIEGEIPRLRRRLTGPNARLDYPVLAEFRDRGATDWLAYAFKFGPETYPTALKGTIVTLASDDPQGFSPEQEAILDHLAPRIGLVVFRLTLVHAAVSMFDAYLGTHAGQRIVSGQVVRGAVERLSAAILFADLRGFTRFAETTAPEAVIAGLNDYLGATVEAIAAHEGAVLKFLGDGLLAVFDVEGRGEAEVCSAALAAAGDALAANAALNEARAAEGQPTLGLDIALHLGEVLYGNIGAARRLDFTVIGPAVNQASRIEALCGPLGESLLISERFAGACGRPLRALGAHELRGVAQPQALFALE